jgi:hypothetical protein
LAGRSEYGGKAMQEVEDRVDSLEVMLGRMIIEGDRLQQRWDKRIAELTALIDSNERRAGEWRENWEKQSEQDRIRALEERKNIENRAEQDRLRVEEDRKNIEEWRKNWESQREQDRQASEQERLRAEAQRKNWESKWEQDRQSAEEHRKAWESKWEEDRQSAEEHRKAWERKWEEDRLRAAEERKAINKQWGELSHKLGTIVEDIVAPNIPRIARELFGCPQVDDLMQFRQVRNKKNPALRREFDVIAVCGDKVLINETKSTVRKSYIDEFIEVLPQIFDYFPEYAGKTIVPVLSALSISPDMVNYLTKNRIYALAMGDETMELLNKAEVDHRGSSSNE